MPYEQHDVFREPGRNTQLRRYLNLTKFVWMLDRRALYFSRSDRLGDKFEGSMSLANVRERQKGNEQPLDAGKPTVIHDLARARQDILRLVYVNCWTLGRYESVAMWRLYVDDGNGIAIESTFGRLVSSLRAEPRPIFAGKVRYIDYNTLRVPENNILYPFVHKRRSFEYEKEIRAVTSTLFGVEPQPGEQSTLLEPGPEGLAIPVDLERLIVRIRVSPIAGAWFADLVESLMRRYGLTMRVHQSDISGDPVY